MKGLEYLHALNFVHLDLKGGNILLKSNGDIKLADFGACSKINQIKIDEIHGTIGWIAPEILFKGPSIIERYADIWSLGCTVYELFIGTSPFLKKSDF